jgi:hypothetical protein
MQREPLLNHSSWNSSSSKQQRTTANTIAISNDSPQMEPAATHQIQGPICNSSPADAEATAAFISVASLADSSPAQLAKFTAVLAQLAAVGSLPSGQGTAVGHDVLVAILDELDDDTSVFGMACLQHARHLDIAVLHLVLQLGSGSKDGGLTKTRKLKAAAQHYKSGLSLQEALQAHLAAQHNAQQAASSVLQGTSAPATHTSATQATHNIVAAGTAASTAAPSSSAGFAAPAVAGDAQQQHGMGARLAMKTIAETNHGVRQKLVHWLGSDEPDESKVLHGAKFLRLLPAVAALDDAAVVRLLSVAGKRINAGAGLRLLRRFADEYMSNRDVYQASDAVVRVRVV